MDGWIDGWLFPARKTYVYLLLAPNRHVFQVSDNLIFIFMGNWANLAFIKPVCRYDAS